MSDSSLTPIPIPAPIRSAIGQVVADITRVTAELVELQRRRQEWLELLKSVYGTDDIDEIGGVLYVAKKSKENA